LIRLLALVLLPALLALPAGAAGAAAALAAPDEPWLDPHLAPLAPLLGKTFRGEMANSTPEKPVYDVSRYERALNGRAVRNLHSVNDGEYGGETLIYWDEGAQSLVFQYYTTAGFNTQGTMIAEANRYVSREEVTGESKGVTVVESVAELLPDGRLRTSSRYLRHGEWEQGHGAIYVEDPAAEVRFR
jgi:hypothetical protein